MIETTETQGLRTQIEMSIRDALYMAAALDADNDLKELIIKRVAANLIESLDAGKPSCGVCGQKLTPIRGRYPGEPEREVCCCCAVETLEASADITGEDRQEPCPNCKEPVVNCACMRNICIRCGNAVGNITFTVCDECWTGDYPSNKNEAADVRRWTPSSV